MPVVLAKLWSRLAASKHRQTDGREARVSAWDEACEGFRRHVIAHLRR